MSVSSGSEQATRDFLQQHVNTIISGLPDLVYIIDKNCSLVSCNDNLLKFLNVSNTDQLIANIYKQLTTIGGWSPERVSKLKEQDIHSLLEGETQYAIKESPVVDNKNNIYYYQSSRVPVLDSQHKIVGLTVTLADITEQIKMAEQIEKLHEQLKHKNSQSTIISSSVDHSTKLPHILLIEDNSIAQKAVQAILLQLDCHVEVAANSEEMAEQFVAGKYDLIFMDIGLKDTSGYIMAKTIRRLEEGTNHHAVIIALTGYEAEVVKYDCKDYSMEGAITKPLTHEQAKQIIQHYIHHIDIPVAGLKSV